MIDLGTVKPGATIRIPFSSFDKDDGSQITMTNFAVADIFIYKDGSTTQRASTSGFTATTDFDSADQAVGKHLAIIDLADNTTAGFYSAGSEYLVGIGAVTVDAVTTGAWIARFRIGYRGSVLDTTIATYTNATSFTLTTGPAEDDALNGTWAVIHDVASAVQLAYVVIEDYTGSTKAVTLSAGASFTAAATDNISVMGPVPLQATAQKLISAGRTHLIGTAGQGDANATQIAGSNVSTTTAQLGVNIVQISTDATAADNAELFFDGTGYAGTGNTIPTVTTLTNAPSNSSGVTTLLAKFTGITALAEWLGLIAGKQSGNSTARTEMRATGAASGTYDETTDSLEAFKDATATAAQVAAAVTATIQLKKNTALSNYPFTVYLTGTRTPATGKTITAQKLLDADSAFTSMTNSAAEVGSTGTYRINIAAADANGNTGTWKFTATGCDPLIIHFVTQS